MTDIRAAALRFEAVSLGLKKTNPGPVLTLRIHPQEMPADLWDHSLGSRYVVALVRLGDDDQPEVKEPQQPEPPAERATARKTVKQAWGEMKLSARAGIICGDPLFYDWSARLGLPPGITVNPSDPITAANWLRRRTAVQSRKEYDTDNAAGQRYLSVERAFLAHKQDMERYGQ